MLATDWLNGVIVGELNGPVTAGLEVFSLFTKANQKEKGEEEGDEEQAELEAKVE